MKLPHINLGGVLNTLGDIPGLGLLKDAAKLIAPEAISNLSPADQAAYQQALLKHEEAMASIDADNLKSVISESLAEIQSSDKFVSRARPTQVYIAGLITAAMAIGELAGVHIDTGAIVTLLAPLWGNAVWYTYNRSQEKLAGKAQ